jgi:hypothetical protein
VSDLGEWDDDTELPPEPSGTPEPAKTEPEQALVYPDLVSFVQEKLYPAYRRSVSGTDRTWCPSWWKHEEANSRLESLWRSWEFLCPNGSINMSVWWRDTRVILPPKGSFEATRGFKGLKDSITGIRAQSNPH